MHPDTGAPTRSERILSARCHWRNLEMSCSCGLKEVSGCTVPRACALVRVLAHFSSFLCIVPRARFWRAVACLRMWVACGVALGIFMLYDGRSFSLQRPSFSRQHSRTGHEPHVCQWVSLSTTMFTNGDHSTLPSPLHSFLPFTLSPHL